MPMRTDARLGNQLPELSYFQQRRYDTREVQEWDTPEGIGFAVASLLEFTSLLILSDPPLDGTKF